MANTRFEIKEVLAAARNAILTTARGKLIKTPCFAAVATAGALKGALTSDLPSGGYDLLLSNTYHLMLRPGVETVEFLGGLHRMLAWEGAILTDSGGFQVFSLADIRKLSEEGVVFRNHLDGGPLQMTPELVIAAQERFGSDIAMVLDVCPALPSPPSEIKKAVDVSLRWAARSLVARRRHDMAIFGIVQGGTDITLRQASAMGTVALGFDGYAIGGLSVGESAEKMYATLDGVLPCLPSTQVRYLMGVGRPDNIVEAVARGVDLFDCVLPTRNARNGKLLTWDGFLNIQRAEFSRSTAPIDSRCRCPTCQHYSRGLLRHLYKSNELNFFRLATVHNLWFMADLMQQIRNSIAQGAFDELRARVAACYATTPANA